MSRQCQISSTSSLALALTCLCLCTAYVGGAFLSHPFSQARFKQLKCGGTYDRIILSALDDVCTFCYNLFEYHDEKKLTPTMMKLCSQDCFSSEYFVGCLEASLLLNEQEEYQRKVATLNGKGFDLATTKSTSDAMSPAGAMKSMMTKMSRSG